MSTSQVGPQANRPTGIVAIKESAGFYIEGWIGESDIENWFTYHSPTPEQVPKYLEIREAGKAFAAVVVKNTPSSADQTAAVRKIREAVMTANQAIACGKA